MATAPQPTMEKPTEDRAWPGSDQVADPVLGEPTAPCEGRSPGRRGARPARGETQRPNERRLPLKTRIALGVVGGLLVVLGIAGLFLPFLQGILFLVLAAAVLSLTSRRIYAWLARTIGERWPGAWERVERFRTRVRWKLRR